MGLYDDVVETARRTMTLFFIVDVSGSMSGSKIGSVNAAIEEAVPEIRDISENNADARIKIATMTFSTGVQWRDVEPIAAENYRWDHIDAGGLTALGAACLELNEKLSVKNGFMKEATGSVAPAIFLLSDGDPTDDYKRGLEELKQNPWFKAATKVALAIGKDANEKVLAEFTGNTESVITVYSPEALRQWIRFVSVTASQVASQSATAVVGGVGAITKNDAMAQAVAATRASDAQTWEAYDDGENW